MAPSIGVNLRVTGHCSQGGRKHMEDMFSVAYQQTEDDKDLEYAFFGIFDGHGGREAAMFAKDHLMDFIVNQKAFWSDSDEEIMRAIKEGFIQTHYAMWRELETWPRTASGLPSTAGTTASIAFIRKGKIYIGHVGDSQIILGFKNEGQDEWDGVPLTREHKPENDEEIARIKKSGGKVVSKQGVPRVVWNRPRIGHKGPVRRSTHIDEIPFLAVARSLGDLWSYNSELDEFVVSPEPDVEVVDIRVGVHKCLIFGTDGLWNMMTPGAAARIVRGAERHNERRSQEQPGPAHQWVNPSKSLVDRALGQWSVTCMRADNTSAVTLMLDPPGPPRAEVLRRRTGLCEVPTHSAGPKGCVAVFTRHSVGEETGVTTSKCQVFPPVPADIKVQINEVSSSIGEARETPLVVKREPEASQDHQARTPGVLQSANAKRDAERSQEAADSRLFVGTRPDGEGDSSDVENCVEVIENAGFAPSRVTPDRLVTSTVPPPPDKRDLATPDGRRLRSSAISDNAVRTLRSRNADPTPKIRSVLARAPRVKRLVRPLTSRRCKPIVLRRRLRKRLAK